MKTSEQSKSNLVLHFIFCDFDKNPKLCSQKALALINAGIEPNYYNKDGYTALQYAWKYRQIEAVKFCMESNKRTQIFDFKLKTKYGQTLLHIAWMFSFDQFLDLFLSEPSHTRKYLFNQISYNDRDKNGRKACEFVLYNSHYFKKLKRIEKYYVSHRLKHNQDDSRNAARSYNNNYYTQNYSDDLHEGNVPDNQNESRPMINSMSVSGSGLRIHILNESRPNKFTKTLLI